jgi:5-hydroxyisourate hydrolase-like protein (transthyretin family)
MRSPRIWIAAAVALLCGSLAAAQDTGPLARGDSAISGRVIDAETGVPIAGARVDLRVTAGGSPADAVFTDGAGRFAISGFAAGAYRLSAHRLGYVEAGPFAEPATQSVTVAARQQLDDLTLRLRRAVILTGTIVDEYGDPVERIGVFAQKIRYGSDGVPTAASVSVIPDWTNDLGQFRLFGLPPGDYLISASGRNPQADLGMPILVGPVTPSETVPTYYPGTPRVAEAQVLSLVSGEERSLHFALSHRRPVTIAGSVMTSAGRPAAGMRVNLRTVAGQSVTVLGAGTTSATGAFVIQSVSPGAYWVEVSPGPGAGRSERGAVPVHVDDEDVTGLSITLNPGATLTGTVVFDSSFRPGTFQIQAQPADRSDGTAQGSVSDPVGDDGRFIVRHADGKVFLTPANALWIITSVMVDGRELGEEPIDLRGQASLSGLRVTVTDRLTDVSGGVADDRGGPLAAHSIVFLRLDAPHLPLDLRVRVLKTNANGQFQVRGLRPGSYVVGVVAELDAGHQFSPDFQDALTTNGRRFSLGPGQPLILELGVTSGL